ncbi:MULTISPECIES: hypothetical protein [Hyphomonas]|nr:MULTISPECIES: hypothetical protein [Hyphomonas]|tara:strand:- start:132 stop:545 length:414 start_codon:yes stop_codon:yes gene_type:complete
MSGLKNMSGLWSGEYRYNANGECVSFTAMLTEIDGKLCGTTLEPVTFGPLLGYEPEYDATIRGDRCGQHVLLSKRYVPETGIIQPDLIYCGAVDASFMLFTGRWSFSEDARITGTFSLSRVASRTGASLAVQLAAGA